MARQRNNIYAVAADAVDLALDTAGTIVGTAGTIVGGMAHIVGIGNSDKEDRKDADDAAARVATSLRQEADAAEPRSHSVKADSKRANTTKRAKSVKKETKRRAARKVA